MASKVPESWSKARRFEEALKRVLDDEWTQTRAADHYGINRQYLNKRVKDEKLSREEAAKVVARLPIIREERRVGSFYEFDRYYWGHLQCPDCGMSHDWPDFHHEIAAELEGNHPRVLVNLPPYHAKTTLGSIKHTVYDIVKNPNLRTLIVSQTIGFARIIMQGITQFLENDEIYMPGRNLIEDWGPFRPQGKSIWNQSQIYVAGRSSAEKDPTVQVVGYKGQIYGRRADKLKFDDLASLDNSRNPEQVIQMMEWINKMALSRIGKLGQAFWFGTRVAAGDIYYHLGQNKGYKIIRFPVIVDEYNQETLWPEHFPWEQAMVHRDEMNLADFQLVYMNVDTPGIGASFTEEVLAHAQDYERMPQSHPGTWRLVGGLDLAGANKDSGVTCFTLLGVDVATGRRYVVDQYAEKQMKSPAIKDLMLEWSRQYPIYEWRVEANGLQSQIIQFDVDLIRELALKGIRVVPHITAGVGGYTRGGSANKWDPQWGVESIAPLFSADLYSIPWGNRLAQDYFRPLIDELISFPMGMTQDRVMSLWFAELGVRDLLRRQHMPLFDSRARVPGRIRRNRVVVDFRNQDIRRASTYDERAPVFSGEGGPGRLLSAPIMRQEDVEEYIEALPADDEPEVTNVASTVWGKWDVDRRSGSR